ncbi:MAG: LysR family transcriptional regulator [Bacteriovoracaceae bacterium]
MKISNLGLSAFQVTATLQNMTQAAEVLGLTQSALSQRIMKLEDELEVTLFIRDGKQLRLTDAGHRLLQYCQTQSSLEDELLYSLRGGQEELAGVIRIGAYSSILRSLLIPKLSPFLRKHRKVDLSFRSYEMNELPSVLARGEADMIVMDYNLIRNGIVTQEISKEEFVVIQSKKFAIEEEIYLDHGPHDNATESFFLSQKNAPKFYRRAFMGDVYGIIDGVKQGLGKAVMSKHLIENEKDVEIIKGYSKYHRPISLHYYQRPYYSKLFSRIIDELAK